MSELRRVRLSQIDPNPWRDGTGKATWDTVKASYGYREDKIEELSSSIEKNEFWEGVIGREVGGRIQIAFGHHRLETARRKGLKEAPIIVRDLTDEQMLSFMAGENSTTFGSSFLLAVMNPIDALLNAYAEGVPGIDLTPEDTRKARQLVLASGVKTGKLFTLLSIGSRFGWTRSARVSGGEYQMADEKVGVAVDLREYVIKKYVTLNEIKQLDTIKNARILRDVIRARVNAERAQIDATVSVKEEALKKAEKEGDTNKAEVLRASIEDLNKKASQQAKKAGRAAAKSVVEDFSPKPVSEVVEDAGPKSEVETRHVKTATQMLYDLIALWERTCLDTDPKFVRAMDGSAASKRAAYEALMRLSERAKNRAKEVK